MRSTILSLLAFATVGLLAPAHAEPFGHEHDNAWADTPKGRFECRYGSSEKPTLLKLAGRTLFSGALMGVATRDGPLSDGIFSNDVGCPTVIASERGYVVIVRPTQPPHYGIGGYALLDFNATPPRSIELAESQSPQDDKIARPKRLRWSNDALVLTFVGYAPDAPGGSVNSPKPKTRSVRYEFASGDITQLR